VHAEVDGNERSFASSVGSLARARAWSMERARDAGAPKRVVDSVQLAMSEAFTNAVRHAPGSQSITVRAVHREREVTFEVHDGTTTAPRRRSGREGLPGGHGLHILDAVTSGWGWRPTRGAGKVVWFTVRW
jgi:anti-sigma regulatory factor (Ser/Thr protein kinase)